MLQLLALVCCSIRPARLLPAAPRAGARLQERPLCATIAPQVAPGPHLGGHETSPGGPGRPAPALHVVAAAAVLPGTGAVAPAHHELAVAA